MKFLATALATAALTFGQVPAVSIRPSMPNLAGSDAASLPGAGRPAAPLLGYLPGPGPLDLRTILGTAVAPQLGGPLALPPGVKRFFVPPREQYLLLESASPQALSIWLPAQQTAPVPLAGALSHPSLVTFSARGEAAVLYASGGLQVISGLPGSPVVTSHLSPTPFGDPIGFTVSDDGALLMAAFADGSVISSVRGANWRGLPAAFGASPMSFIPGTHTLVMSDISQGTLSILEMDQANPSPRLLLNELAVDRLTFHNPARLLAASSSMGKLWIIDLQTFSPPAVTAITPGGLLPLRDGHTFLLSSPPSFSLLHVADEAAASVDLVPLNN